MATYDFICEFCSHKEEVHASMLEKVLSPTCRYCGLQMVRVWSAAPIHFKGSGFYKTGG